MTDTMTDQLPDEPTGATIDGKPWEEARPPHLPDTVTGLPVPTILFALGAIAVAVKEVNDLRFIDFSDVSLAVSAVLGSIPPVVAFLLPAALFLRHRDAWSGHRAMAIGTILFALGQVVRVVAPAFDDWAQTVIPSDLTFLNPLVVGRQMLIAALAALAAAFVGRGLVDGRQYEDVDGTRRRWVMVAIVAAAAALLNLLALGTLPTDLSDSDFTTYYWLTLVSLGLSVATIVAWAYVTGNAMAGRLAGERPGTGWLFASFAGQSILALFMLAGLASAFAVFTNTSAPPSFLLLFPTLQVIGYLSLLIAFLAGLPTSHAPDPADEADADDVPGSDDPTVATATPDDVAGSTA